MKKIYKMIIGLYLICMVLTFGITLGYFQNRFPVIAKKTCREDIGFAVVMSIIQPVGLFVAFTMSGFVVYGIRFSCLN